MNTTDALCLTREAERLDALRKLDLLDTPPSESFDRITRMAAQLFGLPIAAISLTDSDRQWFKSRVGVSHWSIPRAQAPCAAVADSSSLLVVPDLLRDDAFRDSPLAASGVRFYAGAPLVTAEGHCLGAMCVLGVEPRRATEAELLSLRDLASMVMAQIELQHALGRIDPASGLPNRKQFIEDFKDLAIDRPEGESRVAVLMNLATPEQLDSAMRVMGAAYLDAMLGEAARWLRARIGEGQKLYHVGATQFATIAAPGFDLAACHADCVAWLRQHHHAASARYVTTAAFGLAPFAVGVNDCLDVLRCCHNAAQDAIDTASRVGVYSASQDESYQRRFALLRAFGGALEQNDQLHLVYQPRIDLASGRCVGAEALLRWDHPELGAVSPAEFIPIIEQTSVARGTTAWVLEAALTQLAQWQADGIGLQLSVNVSPANLVETDFAARVIDGVARHALSAASLELEITEGAIMANPNQAQMTLSALAQAGIAIAIDDFGTGYSSLAYLQRLPADVVKIDQSFIRGLDRNPRGQALVGAMITLSHDLGYRVVAEGVERETIAALLRSAGCDEVQGYLYARPMPPAEFIDWWQARSGE
ncbi:MAG: GGDEF and EAL domain-containing protein [Massilia sp.]